MVARLTQLRLDHTEYTCLKALVLFKPEVVGLKQGLQVEVLQDQTHLMLQVPLYQIIPCLNQKLSFPNRVRHFGASCSPWMETVGSFCLPFFTVSSFVSNPGVLPCQTTPCQQSAIWATSACPPRYQQIQVNFKKALNFTLVLWSGLF